MLVHSPTAGWWIAEQWETGDSFRVRGLGQEAVLPFSGDLSFFQVRFPDPLRGGRRLSAISIFRDALLQRKDLFVAGKIGRAHVCTPVTNAHLVCRLLLEKKKKKPKSCH